MRDLNNTKLRISRRGHSSLKNSCIKVFSPIQIFILLTLIIFGFSAFFIIHPQLSTPTSAAYVNEQFTFQGSGAATVTVYVGYDNSYCSILSIDADSYFGDYINFTIEMSIRSGYMWAYDEYSTEIEDR